MTASYPSMPLSTLKADGRYSMVGGPFGSKLVSRDYVDEGVPVIRGGNLPIEARFSFDDLVFVTEEKVASDLVGNLAFPGDIVVTQRGTLGQVGLIPDDSLYPRFVVSQSQMKLTVDRSKADPVFVYYALKSPIGQHEIRSRAITAGVPHINLLLFQQLQLPLPPLSTQRKIAAILSAYDDLIDNNRHRINILAEMGQRIYREWFVDLRYPGHQSGSLVDSELGPIPEEWGISSLATLSTVIMGQSPPSSAYNRDQRGLPFHQGVGTYGVHYPIHEVYSTAGTRVAEAGDTLVSVRAPVGRINIADRKLILGRGLCAVSPAAAPRYFLLHALMHTFRDEDSMGNGAIFKAVTRRDVEGIPVLWPGLERAGRFDALVRPSWEEIRSLTRAVENLRETRDFLLPRLISGNVDVEHLDIEVEEPAA